MAVSDAFQQAPRRRRQGRDRATAVRPPGASAAAAAQPRSKGLEEQMKVMEKHGLVMDEAGVKKGLELAKAQRELKATTDGLKVSIGSALVPGLGHRRPGDHAANPGVHLGDAEHPRLQLPRRCALGRRPRRPADRLDRRLGVRRARNHRHRGRAPVHRGRRRDRAGRRRAGRSPTRRSGGFAPASTPPSTPIKNTVVAVVKAIIANWKRSRPRCSAHRADRDRRSPRSTRSRPMSR